MLLPNKERQKTQHKIIYTRFLRWLPEKIAQGKHWVSFPRVGTLIYPFAVLYIDHWFWQSLHPLEDRVGGVWVAFLKIKRRLIKNTCNGKPPKETVDEGTRWEFRPDCFILSTHLLSLAARLSSAPRWISGKRKPPFAHFTLGPPSCQVSAEQRCIRGLQLKGSRMANCHEFLQEVWQLGIPLLSPSPRLIAENLQHENCLAYQLQLLPSFPYATSIPTYLLTLWK